MDDRVREEFLNGAPKSEAKALQAFVAGNSENALKTKPKVRLAGACSVSLYPKGQDALSLAMALSTWKHVSDATGCVSASLDATGAGNSLEPVLCGRTTHDSMLGPVRKPNGQLRIPSMELRRPEVHTDMYVVGEESGVSALASGTPPQCSWVGIARPAVKKHRICLTRPRDQAEPTCKRPLFDTSIAFTMETKTPEDRKAALWPRITCPFPAPDGKSETESAKMELARGTPPQAPT